MNEKELIIYYNKFNEDKRLNTRHGKIEFMTSIKYIEEVLETYNNPKILDVGAGCGKYSGYFKEKGYDVTAVELVKHNLRVIEKNYPNVNCILGNAVNLEKLEDKSFDIILLFGPMYHLISLEEKVKALKEAKRVLKDNGTIFVAYIMNEYAMISHGIKENAIMESIKTNKIDENYHIVSKENDLYSYVRIEDIDELNKITKLKRVKIFTPDGPANYIRQYVNKLDEDAFKEFYKYHLSICERKDLLGAAAHIVDIVKKS